MYVLKNEHYIDQETICSLEDESLDMLTRISYFSVGIYMFKVNKETRCGIWTRCGICSKLTIKILEQCRTISDPAFFSEIGPDKPIFYKLFKNVTDHSKKTNRAIVFSRRPLPNILKQRDHTWAEGKQGPQVRSSNNLQNMIPPGRYCKLQLVCMKVQFHSSSELTLEYN